MLQGCKRERRRARDDRLQAREARAAECRAQEIQIADRDQLLGEQRDTVRAQNTLLDSIRLEHERDSDPRRTFLADMRLEHERESTHRHALLLEMRQERTREVTEWRDMWAGVRGDLQQERDEWAHTMDQNHQRQQQMRQRWDELLQAYQAHVTLPIATGAIATGANSTGQQASPKRRLLYWLACRPRPHKD